MNIDRLTQEQWEQLTNAYNAYTLQRVTLVKPKNCKSIPREVWDEWEVVVSQYIDRLRHIRTREELKGELSRIAIPRIGEESIRATADKLCNCLGINPNIMLEPELSFNGIGFIQLDTKDVLEFVKYKVASLRDMSNLELYKFLSQNKEQIKEMLR